MGVLGVCLVSWESAWESVWVGVLEINIEFMVDVHGSLMVDVHGVCDGVCGGCPWSCGGCPWSLCLKFMVGVLGIYVLAVLGLAFR